jgi:hypothetical protein
VATRLALAPVGAPRKPTAQKALTGTLRADRVNAREPDMPAVALPTPPDGLSDHEREAWVELASVIDPMQIATASDRVAFRLFVEAVGMLATLRQSFSDAGGSPVYEVVTKSGVQLATRPEVVQIATYQKLCLLHAVRWGLSPADRSRVSALSGSAGGNDPLARWRLGARGKQK